MMVINRFWVPTDAEASFAGAVEQARAHLAGAPGVEWVELQRNLDDPHLWALISRWRDVRSYRKALGGGGAYQLIPAMEYAIDEPSAYLAPDEVGPNIPRGQ